MADKVYNATCEVIDSWGPPLTFCGARTAWIYPTADRGYMALCEEHSHGHQRYAIRVADAPEALAPIDEKSRTFKPKAMADDFRRRWKLFNGELPTDEQTARYVADWSANLTREGWSAAVSPGGRAS